MAHTDMKRWFPLVSPVALAGLALLAVSAVGCAPSETSPGSLGGAPARTGGTTGSGGAASGGSGPAATGGMDALGTGGASTATGGSIVPGTGGVSVPATGGVSVPATGGTTGSGGMAGSTASGGRSGSGGASGNGGVSGALRLRPSADGRILQWTDGTALFLLSDTVWLLPARYTLAEVTAHANTRAQQGFTAMQMTASFPENGYQPLETVFLNGDFTTPVPAYWTSLDAKIKAITDAGLVVILNPFWKKTSDAVIMSNGATKCRAYGKWLGTRYRANTHVIYFLGGDNSPGTVRAQVDAMGLGIQDAYSEAGLPAAIVAYHGAPARTSREEWPTNPAWLTLDWSYAYSVPLGAPVPYQENWTDWPKTPPIPIMFGEGWYDRDNGATNSSRWANRFMLRRQVWWNPLSGALAGYAYGAEPIWFHAYGGYTPAQAALWNSGLDAARMKKFITALEWWRLRPDLNEAFITGGNGTAGDVDYAVGALADDGSFGVVYVPTARNLTLKMPAGRTYTLRWFDPSNGTYRAGSVAGAAGASVLMTHPGNNASGTADWVIHVGP